MGKRRYLKAFLNYLAQYYNGREVIPGEWDPVAAVDGGRPPGSMPK
jgi:hypothetical protein